MGHVWLIDSDILSSPRILVFAGIPESEDEAYGIGVSWYPNGGKFSVLSKYSQRFDKDIYLNSLLRWSNFRSTTFLCKYGGVRNGYSDREVQPFARKVFGYDWNFLHNGFLDKQQLGQAIKSSKIDLDPFGDTDSELAFCFILGRMYSLSDEIKSGKAKSVDIDQVEDWLNIFRILDNFGNADIMISNNDFSLCYHGKNSDRSLYMQRITPQSERWFGDEDIRFSFDDPQDSFRTFLVISSKNYGNDDLWTPLKKGQLIVIKNASITWTNEKNSLDILGSKKIFYFPKIVEKKVYEEKESPKESKFLINHTTVYKYDEPVELSTHHFRLFPVFDRYQSVTDHHVDISVDGELLEYNDVFDNRVLYYRTKEEYQNLTISSSCQVKVEEKYFSFVGIPDNKRIIPFPWMPWERQMFMPYLLPDELPESQLIELRDYAMSFVHRNNNCMYSVVMDMNQHIFKDYVYKSNSTNLSTTAFAVYMDRVGVCQDFSNLFICMLRLIGIPARYRSGYIYTGNSYENKEQGDATHAWVEVFFPFFGWYGLDPTNGCRVSLDHIRVACGRTYYDATPTAGTIYSGGGKETLSVFVKVEKI